MATLCGLVFVDPHVLSNNDLLPPALGDRCHFESTHDKKKKAKKIKTIAAGSRVSVIVALPLSTSRLPSARQGRGSGWVGVRCGDV